MGCDDDDDRAVQHQTMFPRNEFKNALTHYMTSSFAGKSPFVQCVGVVIIVFIR